MPVLETGTRLALQHVLFLTDFSPSADSALPYAQAIARSYGAKVVVAHVLAPGVRQPIPMEPLPESMDRDYLHAKQELDECYRTTQWGDVPHESVLERGEFWEVVAKLIAYQKIDLIVLGTHGRRGIGKLLLGSVAEDVFRRATVPVLTVGPNATATKGKIAGILFATDFSPGSLHALPYALSLAQQNLTQLTLLHVLPEPGILGEAEETYATRAREEAQVKITLQNLVPLEDAYARHNSDFVVEYGTPAESILAIAREKHSGLIVMGVRRAASFASTHLPWASAHVVVEQARCPVLTVRG